MAKEWSYFDIINTNYPDGEFPIKYDFVTNMLTGEEYYISNVDDFGRADLEPLWNPLNDNTKEYRSKSHIRELTHRPDIYIDRTRVFKTPSDNGDLSLGYMTYFSDSVVTGKATDHYRLFKGSDLSRVTISCSPGSSANIIQDTIGAVVVETNEGSLRAPGNMLINQFVADGETLTLVAYDAAGDILSIVPLTSVSTLCHTRLTGGVVGIEVVSSYNSTSDLNLLDLRSIDNPSLNDFSIKVINEDDSEEILPLNGDTVRIDGLEDFLNDNVNTRSFVVARYKMSLSGRCRVITRNYEIVKNQPVSN